MTEESSEKVRKYPDGEQPQTLGPIWTEARGPRMHETQRARGSCSVLCSSTRIIM